MMLTHWEKIYLYFCLTIIFIGCSFSAYWYFWPVKVMEINNSEAVMVDKGVYQAGDRLVYTLEYCKLKDISGTIQRALVNSIRINYTAYYNNLAPKCGAIKNADLVIPEFVDTGIYHIETTVEYKVNPIKTVYVHWRSVDFRVENNVIKKIDTHDEEDQEKFRDLQYQINEIN